MLDDMYHGSDSVRRDLAAAIDLPALSALSPNAQLLVLARTLDELGLPPWSGIGCDPGRRNIWALVDYPRMNPTAFIQGYDTNRSAGQPIADLGKPRVLRFTAAQRRHEVTPSLYVVSSRKS